VTTMTGARISKLSLTLLPPARPRAPRRIVVAAHADDGATGWSAGLDGSGRWDAVARLGTAVLGQAPSDVNRRHQTLGLAGPPLTQPGDLAPAAIIDNAVLALAAASAGVPLALWLGGRANSRVAVADRIAWADAPDRLTQDGRIAWLVERATARVGEFGFGALTVQPGKADAAAMPALLAALRQAFGAMVTLRIDCAVCPPDALRALLGPARALGVDALINPPRRALGDNAIPLAVGPSPQLHAIVTDGRAHIVRLEPAHHGGAWLAQRFASIARVFQAELLYAGATGLAIELALLGQLAQATPATLQPLDFGPDATAVPGLMIRDGALQLPDGAGLGVAVDQQRLDHDALRRADLPAMAS